MLKDLKETVCAANLELPKYGLVTFTWGADSHNAVSNTAAVDELVFMALHTEVINPGKNARYGLS